MRPEAFASETVAVERIGLNSLDFEAGAGGSDEQGKVKLGRVRVKESEKEALRSS